MYKPQSRFQIFLSKITGEPIRKSVSAPKTKEESYLDEMRKTLHPQEFYMIAVDDDLYAYHSLSVSDPVLQAEITEVYKNRAVMFRNAVAVAGGLIAGQYAYIPVSYKFGTGDNADTIVSATIIDVNGVQFDVLFGGPK